MIERADYNAGGLLSILLKKTKKYVVVLCDKLFLPKNLQTGGKNFIDLSYRDITLLTQLGGIAILSLEVNKMAR